ncbi:MAG: hypothetical protein FWC20_08740 [Oscillospiraceae bacterium]|nr:hypothetical protein [Oscillospiraceae bacterium]MCL2279475.1 hypothetical protein [Oscillospiraceae bacterium]
MITQKQWKIQQLALHMQSAATAIASESAHMSSMRQVMAKEHAIIAEEMSAISMRILKTLEQSIFGGLQDDEFDNMMLQMLRRIEFLTLNAALLACKVKEHKAMAVFAEELLNTSLELQEMYEQKTEYLDIPEVSPRSTVVTDWFYMFTAISGKYIWRENAQFIAEVMDYMPECVQGNRYIVKDGNRNMDIPLIKLGEATSSTGVVIVTDWQSPSKLYAVLAELKIPHSLSNSRVGISKASTADIPVRDCWTASDGSDLIFIDWEKLSS